MTAVNAVLDGLQLLLHFIRNAPLHLLVGLVLAGAVCAGLLFYLVLYFIAPIPRPPRPSEKEFRYILPDGQTSEPESLPCWHDSYVSRKRSVQRGGNLSSAATEIEDAEVFMSVIVPAYNEEERMTGMLEEAVDFLQRAYGIEAANGNVSALQSESPKSAVRTIAGRSATANGTAKQHSLPRSPSGWEILIVSDGSTDRTVETALIFAKNHQDKEFATLNAVGKRMPPAPVGSIRVVSLERNRGKGGAVTHGMRHVRGKYAIFADADGASRFSDLEKLVTECQRIEDAAGRGVAVGSRAHLVGSEAVVKRSFLRNLLMHSFHVFLRLLTPPATAAIKDTQCGFKLFSRPALPFIIPYMHSEGWIFDVEMLMLAELANIPVAEVAIDWREVKGSKLNVLWDSLGMAYGLAVLRAAWSLGVYKRS